MWRNLGLCLALLTAMLSLPAQAEKTAEDYINYIELKPFVTNFGGPGKVRFLKAEVTIQVEDPAAHHAVNAHMAHIRNDLVFLFSAVEEDQVGSVAAQQVLAEKALSAVQQLLKEETGQTHVSDLFFTSFVTQ
ncbi:flagellar basal body-associated FliL family protein [Marinobacterium sediminicola]|uniref:Flagellar protein FliL n=1 Tax=Marinobacterium sediminicola TaxID=518898 RepID=A0ABY1S1C6_9GAMM|nr:flagellar basal body-associated FliL family protein [Marinobacterium sediminicola]ULG69337.1 flagellar basal body-associated FliL family protein [Marinobacterium sediminicola]SMR75482.1 flagellar FliL protein [Marinobacterium sediminicola]